MLTYEKDINILKKEKSKNNFSNPKYINNMLTYQQDINILKTNRKEKKFFEPQRY